MRSKLMFCAFLVVFGTQVIAAQSQAGCALPNSLRPLIGSKYPNMHPVTLSDLNPDDQELFRREHGSTCPGLTRIDFYGDGLPTFALLLLRANGAKRAELIVAHQVTNQWQTVLVDSADASPVPVVWSEKPGKYEDVYGRKTLDAKRPVIVLCGYESWAIMYSWTGNKIGKIWISD
jgi:hypothetical protein